MVTSVPNIYPPQKSLSNHLVLVVDDEEDMDYLIGSILKKLNIEVLFAGSIRDGLDMISSHPRIDLVLLDNRLPDGLGLQHIQQFKDSPGRHVVIMSAYDTSYDRRLAENNGADGFIGKPFSREQITAVVNKMFPDPLATPG